MPLTTAYATFLARASVGEAVTPYDSANAHIGVGDGTTTFSSSQTDLQGANKYRKGMDSGYPVRTASSMTFQSTFGSSEANFAWNEWGVFNASSGGTMMNRKVETLGTKASGSTWILRVQITLTV